jgi:hypothetical protein
MASATLEVRNAASWRNRQLHTVNARFSLDHRDPHIRFAKVIADKQQRGVQPLGQRVSKAISKVQLRWMAALAISLPSRRCKCQIQFAKCDNLQSEGRNKRIDRVARLGRGLRRV